MKKQGSIWQKNRMYDFFRPYVDFCTRCCYAPLTVQGSLPEEGSVIIAPNHTNTLMDALVVLQSRRGETVFGARADIFRRPFVARILRFLRILPFSRQRDGLQAVRDNYRTFEEIDDTLAHGVPFCLFPEGRHRAMHSLLPIGKGVARIALASAQKRRTWLVPTGIDHADFFRVRRATRLRFGEAIDVNAFVAAHAELPEAECYRLLREELGERIKRLILYIPDDADYLSRWMAIQREQQRPAPWWRLPLLVLAAPFFVLSALLTLPLWLLAEGLHLSDPAWRNTVRFGTLLAGMPLLGLLWGILLFATCPWWAAVALLLYFLLSWRIFYDYLKLLQRG